MSFRRQSLEQKAARSAHDTASADKARMPTAHAEARVVTMSVSLGEATQRGDRRSAASLFL
jgi:hypothetical protein